MYVYVYVVEGRIVVVVCMRLYVCVKENAPAVCVQEYENVLP